jgi:hypothetical protein
VRGGTRFIPVRAERPYFQSSVACATGTIDVKFVVGVTSGREREERLPSLFIVVEMELTSYWVES